MVTRKLCLTHIKEAEKFAAFSRIEYVLASYQHCDRCNELRAIIQATNYVGFVGAVVPKTAAIVQDPVLP